jgi:hypothetical protein
MVFKNESGDGLGSSGAELPAVEGGLIFTDSIPEMLGSWGVDVVVKTEDAFLIRGNLGKGEVDVDVKLCGTLDDMRPNGVVKLRDATVHLPFTMLDVSVGILRFRPVLALLDDVDFTLSDEDPYDSDVYNSATLKLSRKWSISAGLGAEGEQRVMAIYRMRFR